MQDRRFTRFSRQTPSPRPAVFAAALVAVLVALAALLRRFPPQTFPYYPACPFHQLTGLLCPGCGTTRALAALAQGHLAESLRYNPLALAALAALLLYAAVAYLRLRRNRPVPSPSPALIAAALALTAAFTLWRNLIPGS